MAARAVIAGIGQTAFGKLPGRSTISMNIEACRAALADAGVEKDAVDALLVKVPTSRVEMMYGQTLAEAMGLEPRFGGVFDQGGASNISMIAIAAMAIEAGQCEVALVCLADNPKTGTRAAYEKPWGEAADMGWSSVVAGYALIARRYVHEFPRGVDLFREIAIAARAHGAANPNAQLKLPLTAEAYDAAPWVVEPLRRDDCCLISDGAAAVVVTSERRAAELGVAEPVPVLGFGQGNSSSDVTLRRDLTQTKADVSAATAFRMAGPDTGRHRLRPALRLLHRHCRDDARSLRLRQSREADRARLRRRVQGRWRPAAQHRWRASVGDRDAGPAARARGRAPRCAAAPPPKSRVRRPASSPTREGSCTRTPR